MVWCTAKRGRNWIVTFSTSKPNLVMFHQHRTDLYFFQSWCTVLPPMRLCAWNTYCDSSLDQTPTGTCIYDPSLQTLEKWSALCTAPESTWLLPPCFKLTKARLDPKWRIASISVLDLPNSHFYTRPYSKSFARHFLWLIGFYHTIIFPKTRHC